MELYISHPAVEATPSHTRLIGVAEWKQIMDEDLPTVSISTPESSGIQNNQHLIRGTITWSKHGCKKSNLKHEDIHQIGTRAEQVIVIDSENHAKARQIAECRSAMDAEPSNLTIIPKGGEKKLKDLTSLSIIRSHVEDANNVDSSFAAEPASAFQIDDTYNPTVVKFIQGVVEEIVTDEIVDEYNNKKLEYLKILHIRDRIKSELTCEHLEYIHQNAEEIVEVVEVSSIPAEVVKQSDIDISTPFPVIGVEQATYCLAAHIAGVIEGTVDSSKAPAF